LIPKMKEPLRDIRFRTVPQCGRVSCRIPKTTNTHSEYVLIFAFPLYHWLHERICMLLDT